MIPASVAYLVVHCSATPAKQDIGFKELDRLHRERGNFKIGYHYIIRRNGEIEKGRDDSTAGAHASGYNDCSIGICMVGGVERAADVRRDHLGNVLSMVPSPSSFTLEQFHRLAVLLQGLQQKFPRAEIVGHRDLPGAISNSDCPCFDVRAWWTDTVSHPDLKS